MAAGAIAAAAAAAAATKRKKEDAEAIEVARSSPSAWGIVVRDRGLAAAADVEGRPTLRGRVHGVDCVVSIALDSQGFAHTRVVATTLAPHDVTLRVLPNATGALAFLKSLVQQDLEVGDRAFDDAFVVQCKPKDAVASLLGPSLRTALQALATWKMTAFVYEGGHVELHFPVVVPDPDAIGAALEAVSEAARWSPPAPLPFR